MHHHPGRYFAKGNYYKLEGVSSPFNRLIYPVPEKNTAGLGGCGAGVLSVSLSTNHVIPFLHGCCAVPPHGNATLNQHRAAEAWHVYGYICIFVELRFCACCFCY